MTRTTFTRISPNEVKFKYNSITFILEEGKAGVYGKGRVIRLHQLNGVKKEFIKCIGWTQFDNNFGTGPDKECIAQKLIKIHEAEYLALNYIKSLLN